MSGFFKFVRLVRVKDGKTVENLPLEQTHLSRLVHGSSNPDGDVLRGESGGGPVIPAAEAAPGGASKRPAVPAAAPKGKAASKSGASKKATPATPVASKGAASVPTAAGAANKRNIDAVTPGAASHKDISVCVNIEEVIEVKQAQCEEQAHNIEVLAERLRGIDEKVATFVRTRKNVPVYNKLVDRQLALRAELVRARVTRENFMDIVTKSMEFQNAQQAMASGRGTWRQQQRLAVLSRDISDAVSSAAKHLGHTTTPNANATSAAAVAEDDLANPWRDIDARKRRRINVPAAAAPTTETPVPALTERLFSSPSSAAGSTKRPASAMSPPTTNSTAATLAPAPPPPPLVGTASIQFDPEDRDMRAFRPSDVTFGAPVFEEAEMLRLCRLFQVNEAAAAPGGSAAAADSVGGKMHPAKTEKGTTAAKSAAGGSALKEASSTNTAPGSSSVAVTNPIHDVERAFDEAVRYDAFSHGAMRDIGVFAYILSPFTRGINAEAIDQHHAATASRTGEVVDAGAAGGKRKATAASVTIGSNRAFEPTGSRIRNRLNIKMKDIRNITNLSVLNFVNVQDGGKSEAEQQTMDFMRFIGEKHYHHKEEDVSYADPVCPNCNTIIEFETRTGMETCQNPKCGMTTYVGVVREIQYLIQPTHNKYQYLKVGHMKTILKRVMAEETTRIPRHVPDRVLAQLRKEGADMQNVNAGRIKKVLRHLGLAKWYDHRHQILWIVTGKTPVRFSSFEIETILAIFEHLVEPYERHRPVQNSNFPYYSYAAHKILQLLGYPKEVLANFPLLQNREKHRQKERIWEKMMKDLGWPYYRS